MKRLIILLAAAFIAGNGPLMFSQSVQKDLQAQFVLKIVSLDRNFSRYGDPIKIGISSNAVFRAMKRFSKNTIKGKPFTPELMNTLDDILKYDAVYIDDNWKENFAAAAEKAKERKALMFCSSYESVERGEAAVAFRTVLGKPKIVVNLVAVKETGSDFPANFLQMTMVFGNL